MSGESSSRGVRQGTVLGCRHKNVVIVGSHETGASSARCADCRAELTRRIEGGAYIYVAYNKDDTEVVYANERSKP